MLWKLRRSRVKEHLFLILKLTHCTIFKMHECASLTGAWSVWRTSILLRVQTSSHATVYLPERFWAMKIILVFQMSRVRTARVRKREVGGFEFLLMRLILRRLLLQIVSGGCCDLSRRLSISRKTLIRRTPNLKVWRRTHLWDWFLQPKHADSWTNIEDFWDERSTIKKWKMMARILVIHYYEMLNQF